QLEVLQSLNDNILNATKWTEILGRAREPLSSVMDDDHSQFAIFLKTRPHILPAYARTIHILGGDEVLTPQGKDS
ncbi:MAG TPA: hypothetical protein PLS49_07110, partial [Candidatus Woesebacteria bacterium]|nr:hypothetical protein [Candidatus Woesebacteria bacterium]